MRATRRSVAVALAVGCLLAATLTVPAHAVDAGGGGGRYAEADWMLRIKGHLWWYLGFAETDVPGQSQPVPENYIGVGRGRCLQIKGHGFIEVFCFAHISVLDVPVTDFSMDPNEDAAHAEGTIGRYHHVLDWTGDGDMSPAPSFAADSSGAFASVNLSRDATASANLFGLRLGARGMDFGFMDQGAGAGVFLQVLHVTTLADGSLVAHRSFRIPVRDGA